MLQMGDVSIRSKLGVQSITAPSFRYPSTIHFDILIVSSCGFTLRMSFHLLCFRRLSHAPVMRLRAHIPPANKCRVIRLIVILDRPDSLPVIIPTTDNGRSTVLDSLALSPKGLGSLTI